MCIDSDIAALYQYLAEIGNENQERLNRVRDFIISQEAELTKLRIRDKNMINHMEADNAIWNWFKVALGKQCQITIEPIQTAEEGVLVYRCTLRKLPPFLPNHVSVVGKSYRTAIRTAYEEVRALYRRKAFTELQRIEHELGIML